MAFGNVFMKGTVWDDKTRLDIVLHKHVTLKLFSIHMTHDNIAFILLQTIIVLTLHHLLNLSQLHITLL